MVPLFAPALISCAVPCLTDASDQEITERTVEGEDGGWVETEVAGGELISSKLSSINSLLCLYGVFSGAWLLAG
jgi:hypothetical protein